MNVSPIFLARIKVWSKLLFWKFLTDSPVGLWRYKFKCYLLINFNMLWHNALYPILSLKGIIFSIWTRQKFACSKSTIKGALAGRRQFLATESLLKTIKNAFYFTSKALSVLKIFEFFSWLFGHLSKCLD